MQIKVYDFLDFLLSLYFPEKNLTFGEVLGLENIPRRWQKVSQFCLKNLLKTKKRSSFTISFQFLHFCPKWLVITKTKGLHLKLVFNFFTFAPPKSQALLNT